MKKEKMPEQERAEKTEKDIKEKKIDMYKKDRRYMAELE